jgi:diadenosine tetraphosphate (Ap4A) HIT family hydrolase
MKLTPQEQKKQELYRDARVNNQYDDIWQNVGKCVFCDMRDKYIFFEENGMVMTVALFAYIDGNLMIVPRRHVKSAKELTPQEWETARKMMYIAKKLIRKVHGIKGVQYLLRDGGIGAQSTVSDHLHIHCIPFDAPDLSVWNYRKLTYTPLENANLYKKETKIMAKLVEKFDQKYTDSGS